MNTPRRGVGRIRVACGIFAGMGLAAAVFGGVLLAGDRSFAAHAVTAEGTLIAAKTQETQVYTDASGDSTSVPYTDATIRFVTSSGRRVEFKSDNIPGSLPVGDRVRVLYEPASPSGARLDSWVDVWSVGTALAVLGLRQVRGGPAGMAGLGAHRSRVRLCLSLDGPAGEPFRVALARPEGQPDRAGPWHG